LEELGRLLQEAVGHDVLLERLWYSLKYNKNLLMVVEGDMDVKMMLKRNDEHGYLYVVARTVQGGA